MRSAATQAPPTVPVEQRAPILDWWAVDGTNPPAHPNQAAFPNMDRIPACAGLGTFPVVVDRDETGIFTRIIGVGNA
jgi:hypothetical protein